MSERPGAGPGSVTWTALADTYLPEDLRERFLAEVASARWRPANGSHPFSPGLGLKEVAIPLAREVGLRGVSHVTYDRPWVMREDDYRLEPHAFDFMIHALILGVRSERNALSMYFLDLGTGIAPMLLVDDREEEPG